MKLKKVNLRFIFRIFGNLPNNIFVDLVYDCGIGYHIELMKLGTILSIENLNEVFELFGSGIRIFVNERTEEFELQRVKKMGKASIY